MQRCTRMGVATLVAGLLATTHARAMMLIDSFDNGTQTALYTGAAAGSTGPSSTSGSWSQNPLGDERTIEAAKLNITGGSLSVLLDVIASAGHTHLNNDAGAEANWSITYGATADLNLNLNGESAFELTFDTVATAITTQAIITTTGNGSSFSAAYFTPLSGVVTIDFTDFDGGAADLSDVDSITFLFDSNGSASRNAFLTQIESVPEPAGAMFLIPLGLAAARRRRGRFERH